MDQRTTQPARVNSQTSHFFKLIKSREFSQLDAYNALDELTDNFDPIKVEFLIEDLHTYIETIKWDYYLKVKEARKSPRYKEMVKNNERVPFMDMFEGLLQIGRERDMEAAFFEIEGPKYLANFFPEENQELTFLNTWIHEVLQRRSLSDPNENPDIQMDTTPSLNWRGSTIELVELIKALIEAGKLPGLADKEIFELLEKYLGYPIDQREKLQTIKKRTKDQTKFIDTLQYAIQSWIDRD